MNKLVKYAMGSALALAMSTPSLAGQSNDPFLNAINALPQTKTADFVSPMTKGAEWLATLPSNSGLYVIKLKTGQFMIMDAGFRFAFYANNLFDLIRGQEITTINELDQVWLIDSRKLTSENLPIFSYGPTKPEADLTVFMPMQKNAKTLSLVNMMFKEKENLRIDVVLTGIMSKKEFNSAANLFCAKDRKEAKLRLMKLKFPVAEDKDSILEQHATCNAKHLLAGKALARMYNIYSYPYLINKHGATTSEIPEDINAFKELIPENPSHSQDFTDVDWNKQ